MPWQQNYDPLHGPLSTIVAALPLVILLGLLALRRVPAYMAALAGLAAALIVAVAVIGMPAPMAGRAALLGVAYGLLPIGWIVLNVMFLYRVTEERGVFLALQRAITGITTDRRLQLLLIAFCFGAFFEGAAGFGTPVAVTGAMLIGLGFPALEASALSLIANTAPVAFGALGTPVIALQGVTGMDLGDLSAMINSGGRSAALARGRNRVFGALVVAEIALAVVLVIGAGLLVRSYSQLASADPGFDPRRMVSLVLNVPGRIEVRNMRVDQERQAVVYDGTGMLGVAQFYQELIRRIDALPGVESAGATFAAPLNHGLFPVVLWPYPVVGSTTAATDQLAYVYPVSPEFFTTFGIRPLAGRLLEATDRRGAPGATVVNEAYARAYLDGQNPVGRRITLSGGNWRPGQAGFNQVGEQTVGEAEIVGVIPNLKQATLQDGVQPAIYLPHEQLTMRKMAVVVRAENDDPAALIPAIRRELEALDSTIPGVFAVYSDVVAASLARQRLGALVLVLFGFVSLTLAAVGTYGLMSFSVNQRFNEIAVRSAFGAERDRLLKMFVTRAAQLAGIGIVLGVAGAIAVRRIVASQLYETSALDPWVLAIVPLTMLAVTLLASYVPARRASRIDVTAALREN